MHSKGNSTKFSIVHFGLKLTETSEIEISANQWHQGEIHFDKIKVLAKGHKIGHFATTPTHLEMCLNSIIRSLLNISLHFAPDFAQKEHFRRFLLNPSKSCKITKIP